MSQGAKQNIQEVGIQTECSFGPIRELQLADLKSGEANNKARSFGNIGFENFFCQPPTV